MHRAVPLPELTERRPPRTPGCGAWPRLRCRFHRPASIIQPRSVSGLTRSAKLLPGAPAASARPDTADPSQLSHPFPKPLRQRPVRPPPRARAPRPHVQLQPRTSGATDDAVVSSDPRCCRSAVSTPSFTCLSTEMHPSPSDSSPSAPLPDPVPALTEHDPKEDISTSLREDISLRYVVASCPTCPAAPATGHRPRARASRPLVPTLIVETFQLFLAGQRRKNLPGTSSTSKAFGLARSMYRLGSCLPTGLIFVTKTQLHRHIRKPVRFQRITP